MVGLLKYAFAAGDLKGLARAAGEGFEFSSQPKIGSVYDKKGDGLRISPHDKYTESGFDRGTTFYEFFKEFYEKHFGEKLTFTQFLDRFWWGKRLVDFTTLSGYFE